MQSGLLLAVLAGAGALFALNLGQSSLFIDEVYSWRASSGSLEDLGFAVRYSEVTPPLYYLILHAWMQVSGGDSETLLRIPSVAAGVALVAAVHWLGCLVAGRVAGLIAAALAAVSPIVLLYSQQVRAYVWVMLALTIAVAAVVQATRGRSGRWLVVGATAAACAVLLHYTAIFILVPLCVWLWRRPELARRGRVAFLAAVALALAAVAPLAWLQLSEGHNSAAETYASLTTLTNASGSAIVQPIAMTRYTAVAAPFILVAIAAVAARAHRALATALVAGALAASGAALVSSSREHGQNPDTRATVATIASDWREGDVVAGIGLLGFDGALEYYGDKLLPGGGRAIAEFATLNAAVDAPQIFDAATAGKRLWLIADPPMGPVQLRETLGLLDYRAASTRVFDGNAPVQLVRAERSAGG